MLESSWEGYATLLANAFDEDALLDAIKKIVNVAKIDLNARAVVIQARDTRCRFSHSPLTIKTFRGSLGSSIIRWSERL